jgi:hypothetical protein
MTKIIVDSTDQITWLNVKHLTLDELYGSFARQECFWEIVQGNGVAVRYYGTIFMRPEKYLIGINGWTGSLCFPIPVVNEKHIISRVGVLSS